MHVSPSPAVVLATIFGCRATWSACARKRQHTTSVVAEWWLPIGLMCCPLTTRCRGQTVTGWVWHLVTARRAEQCNEPSRHTELSTSCACGRPQSMWCRMSSCYSLGHRHPMQALCACSTSQTIFCRQAMSMSFSCAALAKMAACPATSGPPAAAWHCGGHPSAWLDCCGQVPFPIPPPRCNFRSLFL